MYLLLALIIGFSVVIATILNGKLAQKIGIVNDIVINFSVGLLTSFILLVVVEENIPAVANLKTIPYFFYFGGLVGLLVIWASNVIVPKIAAAYLVILAFIGQIFTSAIIDYFFLDLLSKGKIIGGAFILIGLIYNVRVDKANDKQRGRFFLF
ncbi:MAG: DMT family transporter [Vulcanibacillus sp.]